MPFYPTSSGQWLPYRGRDAVKTNIHPLPFAIHVVMGLNLVNDWNVNGHLEMANQRQMNEAQTVP